MNLAIIGLGSSLGDRHRFLRLARAALVALPEMELVATSRIVKTPPMGTTAHGAFLNAALGLRTDLPAGRVVQKLLRIEHNMGRAKNRRKWGDRVIDLDLLLLGQTCHQEPDCTVPHPGLLLRPFALWPAAEVAPHMAHPLNGLPLMQLARRLPAPSVVGCL